MSENTNDRDNLNTSGDKTVAEKKSKKKTAKVTDQKPKKKTVKVAEPTTARPGVIATIVEMLLSADESNPVTKAAILSELTHRFPDRSPDAMKSTLNMQIPSGLRIEKGLEVSSTSTNDGKGYWLSPDQLSRQEKASQAKPSSDKKSKTVPTKKDKDAPAKKSDKKPSGKKKTKKSEESPF